MQKPPSFLDKSAFNSYSFTVTLVPAIVLLLKTFCSDFYWKTVKYQWESKGEGLDR